jgi:uncharacterized membrane protein
MPLWQRMLITLVTMLLTSIVAGLLWCRLFNIDIPSYPVICAGAAIYQADWSAFIRAVGTFAVGFFAAVAAAVAVGLISATTFRSEIVDRLGGSGMDYVLVALFSGVAGTYAFYSPKIHEAVAGIAISVAVIPPIVMLGIGIAKQDSNLIFVSSTIVLGNVFGIYVGSVVMVALLHRISRDRVAS